MEKRDLNRTILILAACFFMGARCQATGFEDLPHKTAPVQPSKSLDDMLDKVPFLSKIPRSFLIGDGYDVKLSGLSMRIDHMAHDSRLPVSQRTCMISLSYITPVSFFTSRLDIPLLSAPTLTSNWSASTLGDYVLFFNRSPVDHAGLNLTITARFK
jgi:hypothetical protein